MANSDSLSLVKEALKGMSLPLYRGDGRKLEILTGLSKDSIKRNLKKLGIKILNVAYQERFPSNEIVLGYICGLIATDGNLLKNSPVIQLSLQEKDKDVIFWVGSELIVNYDSWSPTVIKINDDIKAKLSSYNIISRQDQYKIRITAPKLYSFCKSIGITPCKSLTLDVNIDNQTEEFKLGFFRGCIDGDGSISIPNQLHKSQISLYSASLTFVNYMANLFGGYICKYKDKSVYSMVIKGYQAKLLAIKFTELGIIGIRRKYDRIESLSKLALVMLPRRDKETLKGEFWNNGDSLLNYRQLWENSDKKVGYAAFWARVNQLGWSIEDALNTPKYTHLKMDKRTENNLSLQ